MHTHSLSSLKLSEKCCGLRPEMSLCLSGLTSCRRSAGQKNIITSFCGVRDETLRLHATSQVYKQTQHSQTNKYPHNDARKSSSIKQHEEKTDISCVFDKIHSAKHQIWVYNEHDSASQCLWFLQISLVGQRSLFSYCCLRGIQRECFIEGIAQFRLMILSDKRAEGL